MRTMRNTDGKPTRSEVLSLKMDEDLKDELDSYADQLGQSRSFVIREAVRSYLHGGASSSGSFLARAADLAGVVDAEPDLSTNPEHLEGYGR